MTHELNRGFGQPLARCFVYHGNGRGRYVSPFGDFEHNGRGDVFRGAYEALNL